MWYYILVRIKSRLLKVFALFALPLALIISLFCSNVQIENSAAQTSSNSSIENYDDYIDYFRDNQEEDVNSSIVMLYDVLVDNFDEIKTGSFEISLRSYDGFSQLVRLSEKDQYRAWLGAVNALKYDDPTWFFVDFTQVDYNYDAGLIFKNPTISSDNCYIEGIYNQNNLQQMLDSLEQKREEIYQKIDEDWTDYQKVYFVNEYVVENVEYDITLSKDFVHTVYGSLINGLAVCDGYSYAVQYLLDGLGITNLVCAGQAYNPSNQSSEGHMWSYVKLYGHWYGLDTTWNDPIYYWTPSQEQQEEWKVAYFLKGWNEELDEGFYYMPGDEDRRVIQNYQIYYNTEKYGQIVYELPVPEIELKDYIEPSAIVETQKSIQAGQALSVVVNIENVENLLENMTVAYRKSDDGGITWGDFVQTEQTQITFNQSEQNGLYQFYIITTDKQVVAKIGESIKINLGELYTIKIEAPDGVQVAILPNQTQFVQNEIVTLNFTLPQGKEVDEIWADDPQVQIVKGEDENSYSFNMGSSDLTVSISLKDKLYNISVQEIEGLAYSLTTPNGQNQATLGQEVLLTINGLPIGKELSYIEGIEFEGAIEVGKPISFVMPANDVEISFVLTDIVYAVTVNGPEGLSLKYDSSGIYEQEITITALNLKEDQKLVLSGLDEGLVRYPSNDKIVFIMPAKDVVVQVYTQDIERNAVVKGQSAVKMRFDKTQAYFGQEVKVTLSYSLQQFRVLRVLVNGVEASKISDFEYSFVMPNEEAVVEVETFEIPSLIITNSEIEAGVEFVERNGEFYYLITIESLPQNQYIKSWQALDEKGQSVQVVTRLDKTRFLISLDGSDLTVTFKLSQQGVLYEDDQPPQEDNTLVITLVFVGVVVLLGVICSVFIRKRS